MAGRPRARFAGKPAIHFMPMRSSAAVRIGPAEVGRHRVPERSLGPGMDPDLRWQLRIGDEGDHRSLRERQALVEGRHRGLDVAGREVAESGPSRGRTSRRV